MSGSTSSKPQPEKVTRSSACNCGQVEISVTGVDKGGVLCHCSNCQRASGSAFAYNYRLLNAELEFVKGKDLVKRYADGDTKSGKTLNRHFCTNCGCPLYLMPEVEGLVILHGGSLEGNRPQPKMDLFPENKHSWVGNLTTKSKM